MFKKIQQYLLIHYPLLWNLKFVPVFLIAIGINIIFYFIGYSSTDFTIADSSDYYYTPDGTHEILYFCAVVTGILLLIFWLSSYSKNNAFKIFYPKTSCSLYLEWVLSFVVIFSVVIFPFSSYKGINDKYRASISKSDMIKAVNILNMVDILIPNYKNNYYQEYPENYPYDRMSKGNIADENDKKDLTEGPSEITEITVPVEEYSTATFEDYPDFATLSLLNYNGYNNLYILENFRLKDSNKYTVIEWLKNQDKEKIIELMDAFMKLQEKHGLKSNITRDKWLELVYNPKKYPVGDFNLISRQKGYDSNRYYNSNPSSSTSGYYLEYDKLSRGYNVIMSAYQDDSNLYNVLLISLCVSLCISLFVFSFRTTSGKSWLIALVSLGIILIIDLLISIIIGLAAMGKSGIVVYEVILLFVFIGESIYLGDKINNTKAKGKSNIVLNHFIWFIPAIPATLYALVLTISDRSNDSIVSNFMADNVLGFVWGNFFLTFFSMWFFIRFMLIKWKGLPEY